MKTEIVQVMMSFDQAKSCVERIRNHLGVIGDELENAKVLILDLYEKGGWLALNYKSFRECAKWEFGKSVTRIYELLATAKIERDISDMSETPVTLPSRAAQALAKLPKGTRKRAYEEAKVKSNGAPTSPEVKEVVDRMIAESTNATAPASVQPKKRQQPPGHVTANLACSDPNTLIRWLENRIAKLDMSIGQARQYAEAVATWWASTEARLSQQHIPKP